MNRTQLNQLAEDLSRFRAEHALNMHVVAAVEFVQSNIPVIDADPEPDGEQQRDTVNVLLTCAPCLIERAMAERAGTTGDDLPPLRPVLAILPVTAVLTPDGNLMLSGGGGACREHIQVNDAPPPVPGRTASGLVIPGAGG